ncbi:MAG: rane protein [Pseudonocardiales bacterium]|nr:rane protein [Pseudonocardiales bacterium]
MPLARVRSGATGRWKALKQSTPAIAHLVAAYQHYQRNHGNDLAAAITYFSFLALFPLVLLGVSVTAFVLASRPDLQSELFTHLSSDLPGAFGDTVRQTIQGAIDKRAGVGVIGLAGVLLAGLGWIGNLRTAIDTVWGLPARKRSFLAGKAADALVLAGLGIGAAISVAVTAGGTAASSLVLRGVGLDDVPGAGTATWCLGILLGIAGSMVIYGWLMIRLPEVRVPRRIAWRATLLAAVGFEALKLVGTFYIARITGSAAGAVIGPVVGVLVWIYLVARYQLFCVAWAATAMAAGEPAQPDPASETAAAVPEAGVPSAAPAIPPAAVAAGLLSTGAALGAGSLAALQRWRHRATDRRRSAR